MNSTTNIVTSSAAGLALGIVLVFVIEVVTGVDIPAEVAAAIGTLCVFVLGLFIPAATGPQLGGGR